jgi:hypothetical protein
MAAALTPELEDVVEAVVRAILARHRDTGRPPSAEAVTREALAVLRPLLAGLRRPPEASAGGRIIVERDVLEAVDAGRLILARGAVVTPLARETAAERGVELIAEAS